MPGDACKTNAVAEWPAVRLGPGFTLPATWHDAAPRNVLQSDDGRRNGDDVTVKSFATPSSRRADVPAPAARARAALAALVLWAVPALARAEAAAGARGARPDDAVTFTVSGGISLGVYEAGLTWGVVRYLQAARAGEGPLLFRPSLATVTGASAGAVNAFVAAALWCERPEHRGGVDANLLLDTWLDLDLSEFLPRSAEKYSAGDGLLSAAPLERAGRVVGAAIFGRRAGDSRRTAASPSASPSPRSSRAGATWPASRPRHSGSSSPGASRAVSTAR